MALDRRSVLAGFAGLFGLAPQALAAMGDEDGMAEPAAGTDAGRLLAAIRVHGADAVGDELVRMLDEGFPLTVEEVRRRLNRAKNRRVRARKASSRREAHAGSEVLYRGPLLVTQAFDGRACVTVHGRRVLVGEAIQEYRVVGIGVPGSERRELVNRDDDGSRVVEHGPDCRAVDIPSGSRVLIDLRHGAGAYEVWAAEVVRTEDGRIRLHLWQTRVSPEDIDRDTIPRLAGGTAYSSSPVDKERLIGLLGLPL